MVLMDGAIMLLMYARELANKQLPYIIESEQFAVSKTGAPFLPFIHQ
jgi:hypothetical protein